MLPVLHRRRSGLGADRTDTAEGPDRERSQQTPQGNASRLAGWATGLLATALLVSACAPPPFGARGDLVAEAIAARGGEIVSFRRESRVHVHYGFPGSWRWELAFAAPDRLQLTLPASGGAQSYLARGESLRSSVGGAQVADQPLGGTCYDRLTGWMGLVWLSGLRGGHWRELAAESLPPGTARGLAAGCDALPADAWRLYFDEATHLVRARGPVEVPGIGRVEIEAHFRELRRQDGFWLPFEIEYRLDGQPFFEEQVERWSIGPGAEPVGGP